MSYEHYGHLFDVDGKCVDCGLQVDGREPDTFCTKGNRTHDHFESDPVQMQWEQVSEDEFFHNYQF